MSFHMIDEAQHSTPNISTREITALSKGQSGGLPKNVQATSSHQRTMMTNFMSLTSKALRSGMLRSA